MLRRILIVGLSGFLLFSCLDDKKGGDKEGFRAEFKAEVTKLEDRIKAMEERMDRHEKQPTHQATPTTTAAR